MLDGVKLHNPGSAQYRAFQVGTAGYTTSNVTVCNIDVNNYLSICDFDASVTGVNVINYSPGLIRSMAGVGTNYIDQNNGTAAFNVSRHPWTNIRTITTGTVSAGLLCPYPPLETTTVFAIVDGTGFNILPPRCQPKTGMKQEVVIANQSSRRSRDDHLGHDLHVSLDPEPAGGRRDDCAHVLFQRHELG